MQISDTNLERVLVDGEQHLRKPGNKLPLCRQRPSWWGTIAPVDPTKPRPTTMCSHCRGEAERNHRGN